LPRALLSAWATSRSVGGVRFAAVEVPQWR
jgi:hypothetical protein